MLLLSAENVSKLMASSQSALPKLHPQSVTRLASSSTEEEGGDDVSEGDDQSLDSTEEIEDLGDIHTYWLGTLAENKSETPVVVEEMEIGPDFNDVARSEILFQSLEQVLGLRSELASKFRALSCAGIYHDIDRRAIGLTYRYPEKCASTSGKQPRVFDLAELFREYTNPIEFHRNIFVGLDDRIQLAHELAAAVFEFHKMDWLHKNISSYNVLFFGEKTTSYRVGTEVYTGGTDIDGDGDIDKSCPRKVNLKQPFLIGFSHSRPGSADYSNKMHSADEALFPYRHPDYSGADAADLPTASGFLAEYDYYSLGLVLLEIGLWNPLWHMVRIRTMAKSKIRDTLCRTWIPFLASTVGETFAKAVDTCLSGRLSRFGRAPEKDKVDERFERLVLGPLHNLAMGHS
ncbi:hypothetical protein DL768_010280 [Monosporascus sp. mg162]|nr:hypothetical protein DL768_010280 [Monosporascus sp. mg162]